MYKHLLAFEISCKPVMILSQELSTQTEVYVSIQNKDTSRAYTLEIPCCKIYINVYISMKNNRKKTVNLRKEEALNTVIKDLLIHFLEKVKRKAAFSAKF